MSAEETGHLLLCDLLNDLVEGPDTVPAFWVAVRLREVARGLRANRRDRQVRRSVLIAADKFATKGGHVLALQVWARVVDWTWRTRWIRKNASSGNKNGAEK